MSRPTALPTLDAERAAIPLLALLTISALAQGGCYVPYTDTAATFDDAADVWNESAELESELFPTAGAADLHLDVRQTPDVELSTNSAFDAPADEGQVVPNIPVYLDDEHVLVVPGSDALEFYDDMGRLVASRSIDDMVDDCAGCVLLGASADGDGMLVTWSESAGGGAKGGVVRIDAQGTVGGVDGFAFPHDVARDPVTGHVIVCETSADSLVWVPADWDTNEALYVLGADQTGFEAGHPNGLQVFGYEGRQLAMFSNRGTLMDEAGGFISMWDITDPAGPEQLWRFPSVGYLDTPHGATLRNVDGTWWLAYAHTYGLNVDDVDGDAGTVGLAVTDDPLTPPRYVADLTPGLSAEPFHFLRSIEITADGRVLLTDTGWSGQSTPGRVVVAPLPIYPVTGASGAAHKDQVFYPLRDQRVLVDNLSDPFEGWLWRPTFDL
jgi:hypothetical protein